MSPMGKCLMGKCFKQIYLTQTVLNNWIYPTPGPDRAHRHKQNCIYPQLFGFKPVLRTYAWHTTSSIIEYIPPPLGPTGPRDRKTKLHISTIVWLQISFLLIYFAHNILYNWIYPTSGPDRAHRHKVNSTYPSWVNVLKLMSEVGYIQFRLEICRDRRDRRSCKIFPSCVKFWGKNANSLGNYWVTYALNE